MSKLRSWREKRGWTQQDLATALGLSSKGQISRLESGIGLSTDIAIRINRLTEGEVTVADLRPDLSDIRVLHQDRAA